MIAEKVEEQEHELLEMQKKLQELVEAQEGVEVHDEKSTSAIPVFYNVFTKDEGNVNRVEAIVKEQLSYLNPTQHKVFLRTIGYPLKIENATHLQHDNSGDEIETLQLLWEYCTHNYTATTEREDKVIYIHSKGSFHSHPDNDRLRRFLTRGVASEECTNKLPSTCNVCSSRMSPFPHPHTSGNMWLARCDYVQRLIEPVKFEEAMRKAHPGWKRSWQAAVGLGRYGAEHWIYSHPSAQACDLSADKRYTWAYKNCPEADFDIDFKLAPRFSYETYLNKENLGFEYNQPFGLTWEFRVAEYKALFGEDVDISESWWGWEFFKNYTTNVTGWESFKNSSITNNTDR
jgi:hypothetical protein